MGNRSTSGYPAHRTGDKSNALFYDFIDFLVMKLAW
jgi:hypothetical protein